MESKMRKQSIVLKNILSSITENDKLNVKNKMINAIKLKEELEKQNITPKQYADIIGKTEEEVIDLLGGN
jgi:hypothetical protein